MSSEILHVLAKQNTGNRKPLTLLNQESTKRARIKAKTQRKEGKEGDEHKHSVWDPKIHLFLHPKQLQGLRLHEDQVPKLPPSPSH